MAIDGMSGAEQAKPLKPEEFKPDELKNAKESKVLNSIYDLNNAIAADVHEMEEDGEISADIDKKTGKSEVDRIYDWVHVIDNMIGNISAQVKQSCAEGMQILKIWLADLINMTGMGQYYGQNVEYDGENVTLTDYGSEPEVTDAQQSQKPSDKTKDTAARLRIPDKKFTVISDDKYECNSIKKAYDRCFGDKSNRKIASDLKCFQARYAEQLKTVASSIGDDGKYMIETLYDQVSSQIRFYSELADKDAENNMQDMISAMTQLPSQPTAEQVAAASKSEGPDPRANWVKIVNPD